MAKATYKNPALDNAIEDIFGFNRVNSISNDTCVSCKKEAREFNDPVSRKEYTISGLCQTCQDNVFGI
jgi:hypothetical protein|tara:strand:+ start:257 stop:460 length:204 start_codon:yes stop_codon:yes gene_type:complete